MKTLTVNQVFREIAAGHLVRVCIITSMRGSEAQGWIFAEAWTCFEDGGALDPKLAEGLRDGDLVAYRVPYAPPHGHWIAIVPDQLFAQMGGYDPEGIAFPC